MKKFFSVLLLIILISLCFSSSAFAYTVSYREYFVPDAINSTVVWVSPIKKNGSYFYPTVNSKWNEARTVGTSPHIGCDLPLAIGTVFVAVADGYLRPLNDVNNTASLDVSISHPNWYPNLNVYCQYEHCSQIEQEGFYAMGDQTGKVGNVGQSTGPHLHFGAYSTENFSNRASYRTQPLYRFIAYDSNGRTWSQGKRLDTFYDVEWIDDHIAQISFSISGPNNDDSEIPDEVILYYKKYSETYWSDGIQMSATNNPHTFSFDFSQISNVVNNGSYIKWMVRYKRAGMSSYMWAPAKFYNPHSNPNATSYVYPYFSNTVIYFDWD